MKKEIRLYISIIFMMIVAVFVSPTATIFGSEVINEDVSLEENTKTDFLEIKESINEIVKIGDEIINSSNYGSRYISEDYFLDSYNVEITVNENNTFDITEKITAHFNEYKHGIFRKLPLKNIVERLDGTTSKNIARISDIRVPGDEFNTYKEDGYHVIKIGSADETLIGKKEYTIKYHYNIGKDPSDEFDELYYNIIGNEWDTVIDNVTFKITMPKEFDASKLGFSVGSYGSTNSDGIVYNVNGNIITGRYNGVLEEGQGLTIRLELPEGYFTGYESTTGNFIYFMFGLPILFVLVAFGLWKMYGKDEPIIETVEFYPPEGFNSLEIGYLYKGAAGNQDVVSLMVYLANKGYIKIEEFEETSLFIKSKSFKITKLKEYDGNNVNERRFFNGLFRLGRNEVTMSDLQYKFYRTMNKILASINSKSNERKIFEKSSLSKRVIIVLMIIATFLLITLKPMIDYAGVEFIFIGLLFPAIGFSVLFSMVFGKTPISVKIFGLIWGGMFGGIPFVGFVLPCIIAESTYLAAYVVGIICIAILIVIYKIMPKRTAYGTEIFGKILGFKHFLETVEKEKLEMLVMDNPTYFYDILPYTYVLGVSNKWIKKFEDISLTPPDWYSGSDSFTAASFGAFMTSAVNSAASSMSSSPSSSGGGGGGGSSGGGSSGGGSGGGGGGSW